MENQNWSTFERNLKKLCAHWHSQRKFSLRNIQKMLRDRGVSVHYSTISRWLKRVTVSTIADGSTSNIQEAKMMVKGQSLFIYTLVSDNGSLIDFRFFKKPRPSSLEIFEFKSLQIATRSPWAHEHTGESELSSISL